MGKMTLQQQRMGRGQSSTRMLTVEGGVEYRVYWTRSRARMSSWQAMDGYPEGVEVVDDYTIQGYL